MKKIHRFLTVVAACGFLMVGQPAREEKMVIGASLLTKQHPFYVLLAGAMKKEVEIDGVSLQLSIANHDLNKQLSDLEDFITKGVNAIVISPVNSKGAMYSFT